MNTKDLIRAELDKLSKDDLSDIVLAFIGCYFTAVLNSKMAQANNIQQCINSMQTNIQPTINSMIQELKVNFQKMNNNE